MVPAPYLTQVLKRLPFCYDRRNIQNQTEIGRKELTRTINSTTELRNVSSPHTWGRLGTRENLLNNAAGRLPWSVTGRRGRFAQFDHHLLM